MYQFVIQYNKKAILVVFLALVALVAVLVVLSHHHHHYQLFTYLRNNVKFY